MVMFIDFMEVNMAIVFKKNCCGLCGNLIISYDDIVYIPSIFCNRNDPLYMYNDMYCHKKCFYSIGNSEEILYYVKNVQNEYKKKECYICEKKINSSNDFVFIPIISSDKENEAFKFNCKSFHKKCYEKSELKPYLESICDNNNK